MPPSERIGLLGNFDQPLDLWTQGDLHLHFGNAQHHISARVAHVNGAEAGFAFVFKGQADHDAIQAMIAFARSGSHLVGKVPF